MTGKRRFTYSLLQSICAPDGVVLLNDYSNVYLTRDSRIICKCIHCNNSFDKSFNELDRNRNFGCNVCAKKIKFDRIKNTMIEHYGVEYAAQSDIFKNKMKTTTLERYGCEHALQNKEIKQKIIETNLQKYGC